MQNLEPTDVGSWILKVTEFLSQTLIFLPLYLWNPICRRPLIFQAMNSNRPPSLSVKYQRFGTYGSKDIGIRKSEFVVRTQFLLREWPAMYGSWTEYVVLLKKSLGFICAV